MLPNRVRFCIVMFAAVGLVCLSLACGKKDDEQTTGGPTETGTKYQTTGNEGTISGKVAVTGTLPEAKKIDMSADNVCASKNPNATTQEWVAKDGKLEYTFVYIKDGQTADNKKIGDLSFPTPTTPVVLDQNGCQYKPHVLGLQTGQKLDIKTSDPTTHNIHPTPKVNQEWNQSQTAGAADIEKTFTRSEVMVPVKCNQHPWMKAYIGVLKHPFFAVSGADGSYEIKGVPPGTYTVVAWHEKGNSGDEKTTQVTVPSKGTGTADFTFEAPAATASNPRGSLELLPALELPMLGSH
jgi:plastocyanin